MGWSFTSTAEEMPLTARGLRERKIRWVRAIVFSVAIAFACLLLAISLPETSSPSGEEQNAEMMTWTCDTLDVSLANPEFCSPPDHNMCNFTCLTEDSWCKHFCGEACSRGVGGLCIFQHLAHLDETCASVAATTGVRGTPMPDSYHSMTSAVDSTAILSCDYHAYCSFCAVSDACSRIVAKPNPPFTAAGIAAWALNSVEALCDRRAQSENSTIHEK